MSMQRERRIAVIDVGSNSVRLLVADIGEGDIIPVTHEKRSTRLLAGMQDGWIADDAIERTAHAISELSMLARDMGAQRVCAFGTSAMRDGRNRDALIQKSDETGVPLSVLSGEEEAVLAYAGAAPEGKSGVLDIGGGSTEWLTGEDGVVKRAISTQIGAVRLFEGVRGAQSPRALIERAKAAMADAAEEIQGADVERWIGTGGTITTLAAMLLQLDPYDPEAIHGFRIRAQSARSWLDMLWAMPVSLRGGLKGLEPVRADIIPSGIAILLAFFELTSVQELTVSTKDNLEGFIRTHMM